MTGPKAPDRPEPGHARPTRAGILAALTRPFRIGQVRGVSPENRLNRAYIFGFDSDVPPRSVLKSASLPEVSKK